MATPVNVSRYNDPLTLHKDFNMLSLTDLLEARQKNHAELMLKTNVVGTAVGLYLIRRSDPWPPDQTKGKRGPRTLANSEVRPYSWPCILVFVKKWQSEDRIRWDEMVPEALYLDDRRKVPVCVVEAPPVLTSEPITRNVVFPTDRIGGGFPVIAEVQGKEHTASIGCLLTDGHTTYALTNRHVTGDPGEIVYTKVAGTMIEIGKSSDKQLTHKLFQDVYPGWPAKDTYVNLDIGLIRVDDVSRWSAQIYGIGTMDEMADLGVENISLRLIDCPVRAYGCASGLMKGAIKALFYRYQSMGGFEYVSDFLIGARDEKQEFTTHKGDSGTLWLLEVPNKEAANKETAEYKLRPIAVQWGGQLFSDGAEGRPQVSCALATCLSTICEQLKVDIIRDWNIGGPEYWGETGHYTIGALACTVDFPGLPGLQKLMSNNIDRVGFHIDDLKKNEKVLRNQAHYHFVPLADVPDLAWRNTRPADANNHFADMDQPALNGTYRGKTLLDLCKDPANINPKVWLDFYSAVPGTSPGALPFRVWQIYEAMVDYAKKGDASHFLAAAGCLAHYVGDGSQPLHISRLHHGYPPVEKNSVAYGVHATYETQMLNQKVSEIVDGVVSRIEAKQVRSSFHSGPGAARRVIGLMRETITSLPPSEIVDTYNLGTSPSDRINRLWQKWGEATMDRLAEDCLCLADIWASAWHEGKGEDIPSSELGPVDEGVLESYYNDLEFLPAAGLAEMGTILSHNGYPPKPKGASVLRGKATAGRRRKKSTMKKGRVVLMKK